MSGDAPTTSMTLPSEENAPAPGAALRRAMQYLSTYGTIVGMGLMIFLVVFGFGSIVLDHLVVLVLLYLLLVSVMLLSLRQSNTRQKDSYWA